MPQPAENPRTDPTVLKALREAEFSAEVTEPLFVDPVAEVKRLVINRGGQAQSLQITEYEAAKIVNALRGAFPSIK